VPPHQLLERRLLAAADESVEQLGVRLPGGLPGRGQVADVPQDGTCRGGMHRGALAG
jgi:hypothetical protein